MAGPLAGLRVVELCDERGEYGGKVLADLGATVWKIEPPGGEPSRRIAAREVADGPWFRFANTSKRSVVADLQAAPAQAALRERVLAADLLLESRGPGWLEAHGLAPDELQAAQPALVIARISGFGQEGPRRDWQGSDLVATAMSGAAHTTGWPDEPPVSLAGYPASVLSGLAAASGALVALWHARQIGRGQVVDVSMQEVMASVSSIVGAGRFEEDGVVARREGARLTASIPSGAWDAADGRIYLTLNRPAHWKALASWVAEETDNEAILEPVFEGPSSNRAEFREVIDAWLGDLFGRHPVAALCAEAQRRHIAITPLNDGAAVLEDAHLAARGFFVDLGEAGSARHPGVPFRFSRTPALLAAPAPAAGADSAALAVAEAPPRPLRPASPHLNPVRPDEPLSGLRVLELTAGMAGPWIGRMMAYHGADVVKLESRAAADVTRLYVSPRDPEAGVSEVLSPWFTDWNAGKRFVGVDLKRPEGVALARRLAAEADIVIENFVPGAMERLGLGYADLAAANPRLVHLTTSGFGNEGPAAEYVTWGPNMEAVSGLAALSGVPGRGCTITQYAVSDPVGALHGLAAVMAALEHREQTGEGQQVDIAQLETCVAMIGDVMLAAGDTDPEVARGASRAQGNRRPRGAPWGIYPCRGEDQWCAITALDEGHWVALCEIAAAPHWRTDPRFASFDLRRENADALDHLLAAWTAQLDKHELMQRLQAVGVPAGAVQDIRELCEEDPQLRARDYFERVAHRARGSVRANRFAFHLVSTPGRTTDSGRAIGEDNLAVCRDWLGMADEEQENLQATGVLEKPRR